MSKKIGFSVFFTLSVIVACQSPSNNLNTNHVDSSNSQKSNFKVSDPEASLLNSPILTTPPDNVPDLEPQVISTSNPDNFVPPKVTLNFDYPPDDNLATVKGKIIVFYHNNDKFRVSTTESVSSLNISYQEQINSILKKYKVKGVHSYGYYDPADAKKVICKGKNFNKFHDNDDEDNKDEHNNKKDDTKDKNRFNTKSNDSDDNEQKCDSKNYSDSLITIQAISQEQQDVSKSIEGEFPDKLSIHIYDFPLNSDTKKISQEIRSLSFVRTAYAALKVGTNSEKPIEKVTNNEIKIYTILVSTLFLHLVAMIIMDVLVQHHLHKSVI